MSADLCDGETEVFGAPLVELVDEFGLVDGCEEDGWGLPVA